MTKRKLKPVPAAKAPAAPAPAPMRMKPNVKSLQIVPKAGHTHFVANIPTVNRDKSFLIITHWNFKGQAFHAHINENGSAVDLFFEKPYKRPWFRPRAVISLAVIEMP